VNALVLLVTLVSAQVSNPYWVRGRALYEKQNFAEAMQQLEIARQVPAQPVETRVQILDLLARCQLAEGQRARAEASYAELLSLNPRWTVPDDVAPKIRDAFETAKRRAFPPEHVELTTNLSFPGQVGLRVIDPWRRVARVSGAVRTVGETGWRSVVLTVREGAAILPLPRGEEVEWHVEALSSDDEVLARVGSPERPQRAPAETPVPSPPAVQRSRALPWVLAGVAAAALGSAAYLQTRSAASEQRARAEEWSDTARAHQAAAVTEAHWSVGLMIGGGLAGAGSVFLFTW
jgi:hypothetical protein